MFAAHRLRRFGAAAMIGVAVWLAITAVAPAPPPHEVVVLAADLPAGHVLTAADLTVQRVEDALRPETAVADVDAAVGQRLARPHRAREIVTAGGLATARQLSADDRAVHVPIADPGALLATRPGDRVDLAEGTAGGLVATDVLVLVVDDPTSDTGGHGVVVAVPAGRLAALVPAMSPTGPGVTLALRNARA